MIVLANDRGNNSTRNIGLARVLSKLGYCSRSRAFDLIRAGRVTVNKTIRRDPEFPVQIETARITIDGQPLTAATPIYLLMNKPRGLVTTAADEKGRETIYTLLPKNTPWVGPVGRLDKASEGLLLLTNDSEWAARITDPRTHLDKTYHVQVNTPTTEPLITQLIRGLRVGAELLRVKHATVLRSGQKNSWLEIVLDEGRNRHIRRLLDAFHIEVLRLVRVSIGPLTLGDLPKGAVRELTSEEKAWLDAVL